MYEQVRIDARAFRQGRVELCGGSELYQNVSKLYYEQNSEKSNAGQRGEAVSGSAMIPAEKAATRSGVRFLLCAAAHHPLFVSTNRGDQLIVVRTVTE